VEDDDWSEPAPSIADMIMWGVIGIVAIAGVYVVIKLVPRRERPPPEAEYSYTYA